MPVYYTREQKRKIAEERGIIVDPEDVWLLEEYTWSLNADGYAVTNFPRDVNGYRQRVHLHHAIMGQPIWGDDEIDHVNHNVTDDRRCNLRYVTKSEQGINTTRAAGPSGARNIYIREDGRYHIRIRRNLDEYYLGAFDTLEEAIAERDMWLHQQEEYVSSTK